MRPTLTYYFSLLLSVLFLNLAQAQLPVKTLIIEDKQSSGIDLIKAMKVQVGLRFNYGEVVNARLNVPIKIPSDHLQVKTALDLISAKCGIEYQVSGSYVTLVERRTTPTVQKKRVSKFTAKVVDDSGGAAIPGATVRFGSQNGSTDENGIFTTGAPIGKHQLIISHIG